MDRGAFATRRRREEGFGLIEAVVALVIIFGLILVLMRTLDSSVRVLVETRRASAANAFATELIERAQALEWQHMGLAASTNGTDCTSGQVGCATYLTEFPELASDGAGGWSFDGEPMVFTNADTFKPFLDFHEQVERDGTDFDRYIFVASVDEDGDGREDLRRLTAVVRWQPPGGFPRSVEQSTMVSPFSQPNQPLIRTDVAYSSGWVDVGGHTYDGALAGSSQWPTPATRDLFEAGLTLPGVEITALSDYVSEGRARAEGASIPHLAWAGPDGLLGTADDIRTVLDPTELTSVADDDPLSTPPLVQSALTASAPAVVNADVFPRDLFLVQLERAASLASGLGSDGTMTMRVAAEDDQGTADGLPYAEAGYSGSEKTVVGFLEYGDAASQAFYLAEWGAPFPMSEFGFSLYRRQDRTGVSVPKFTATADRSVSAGDDQSTGTLTFSSPRIELLRDDVIDQSLPGNAFDGWVVIDLPTITVTGITAGESALTLPDPVAAGTARVHVWNPTTNSYDSTVIDYDAHGGSCDSVVAPVVIQVGASGPLTAEVKTSPLPWLTYEVEGTVTINPWCTDVEVDGFITTESLFETVGPIATATLTYRVLDNGPLLPDPTAKPIELYDLTVTMAADSLQITSVFVEPD